MLANAPNGKVSDALAKIYTKEGITLSKPKGANGAEAQEDGLFTPVVYVAKVRKNGGEVVLMVDGGVVRPEGLFFFTFLPTRRRWNQKCI